MHRGRGQEERGAQQDWGPLRPRRLLPHTPREPGEVCDRVSVLVPRFRHPRLRRWCERLRLPPYRVHLDDVGSFVWLHCDGSVPMEEIGQRLSEAFGERVQPVEQRLATFFQQLQRAGMVSLEEDS